MSGLWENNPMRLQLGSLLMDNKRVRINKNSYFDMPKDDDTADLERCSKKWKEGCEPRLQKSTDDENTAPVLQRTLKLLTAATMAILKKKRVS
jgi:hypothetical protein